MNKQTITTAYLFILAAITFWISWLLMPDPGTTDTTHILKIVKEERSSVLASIIVQIISSVLYVAALFFLVKNFNTKKINLTGVISLGVGAMGLCADAFFHLLAYYMTDSSVNIQQDVVRVMEFMQTDALIFLVPVLLPFFFGSLVLAFNLAKQQIVSRTSAWIISAAFIIGILFAVAAKAGIYQAHVPVLGILAIFAFGQAFIGFELIRTSQKIKFA